MFPIIAFEGLDGSGKSFGLSKLKKYYEEQGTPVKVVASIPYDVFKKAHDPDWYSLRNSNALYMQYLAYEVNNYFKNIHDERNSKVILIDRFILSCYAYNDITTDQYGEAFKGVMDMLCRKFFKPDVTFIFEVSMEVLLERYKVTEQPEMVKNIKYMQRVKERYTEFATRFGNEWFIRFISGTLDENPLVLEMSTIVNRIMEEKKSNVNINCV